MKLTNNKTSRTRVGLLLIGLAALIGLWAPVQANTRPTSGTVNLETPHVSPIALTPDGSLLLAVNTAAHMLEVFDTQAPLAPALRTRVPVGAGPVSVRVRGAREAWVVNQEADSVSIVDLNSFAVVRTLRTGNEPADVVFAAGRAFVSCSDARNLNVFDLADLNAAPRKVGIAGLEPRALAVSADGKTVYVAIFESGNQTTVLNGRANDRINVVSRAEGPYAGVNPPPNAGTSFQPPIGTPSNAIPVSLIVRQAANGRWFDDNRGDWTNFVMGPLAPAGGRPVGWFLADNDIAMVDTGTLAVSYQKHLMNINMALAVHPISGQVSVVGTDAVNQIRYEPNLNGRFLRVNIATFAPGNAVSAAVRDLNPHLDYKSSSVAPNLRALSIGDPRGIAWRADGSAAYVTGMGSNNVVAVDAAGKRLGQFSVGRGPTGIVLNNAASVGYVLNKFDASISVVDLAAQSTVASVAFFDPTPAVVKAGRPLLYDTLRGSGTGHVACASCHVDARTDRLAWDLGDPRGSPASVRTTNVFTGALTGSTTPVQPMKGPMLTQTLQDIVRHGSLHWRGDRADVAAFADAFVSLMGADSAPGAADMQALTAFLGTIHLPPNPYRNLDNTRPSKVTLPDGPTVASATMNALRGSNSRNNNCLGCHLQGQSRNPGSNPELGQAFVPQSLALFYKRLGFRTDVASLSVAGTGFFHDGSDSLERAARVSDAERQADMLAELMTLEGPGGPLVGGEIRQDLHAGVGWQITLNGIATASQSADLTRMVNISNSAYANMIATFRSNGVARGAYRLADGQFQSDRLAERWSLSQLQALAVAGTPVTFTVTARGTTFRLSVDRDWDGLLDGDELDRGASPIDGATPTNPLPCAGEGGSCTFSGRAVVRFGSPGAYAYAVYSDGAGCSTAWFGDPGGIAGARSCAIMRPR